MNTTDYIAVMSNPDLARRSIFRNVQDPTIEQIQPAKNTPTLKQVGWELPLKWLNAERILASYTLSN